jgi:hypothetical protein
MVSGNAKVSPEKWTSPFMPFISYEGVDVAKCSCGWSTRSGRVKVREDRIDRHLNKRHNGRGMRMPS